MRNLRLLTTLPAVALCALSFAQQQVAIGKLGEAVNPTAIYKSPDFNSRIIFQVPPSRRLVLTHYKSDDWDKVRLENGRYGYVPAGDVTWLPWTVYLTHKHRASSGASRGGSPIIRAGTGNLLVDTALSYEGTPYEWGGNDLRNGVDCSGFVKKLVGDIGGKNLPRTAAEQALVGMPLHRLEELQPGDRLYFKQKSDSKISHTGIYIGRGQFVHSSHGKGKVTTDSLLKGNWRRMLVAAMR